MILKCASLLLIVLFMLSSIIPDSEALSLSEKRIKKIPHLTKPQKEQPKSLESNKFEMVQTPDKKDKAVSAQAVGKSTGNSTSDLLIPNQETDQPNWSNKTDTRPASPKWDLFTKINAIGIVIECKGCMDYSSIIKYDTAPAVLGTISDKGRANTPAANNAEWLRSYNQTIIVLDPPFKVAQKSKMIHIVSQLPPVNGTLSGSIMTWYHTRIVDPACSNAIITASIPVLEDTISYLKSGCTITKYDTKTVKVMAKPDIDLKTSAQYQDLKKWKAAKDCARTPGCLMP